MRYILIILSLLFWSCSNYWEQQGSPSYNQDDWIAKNEELKKNLNTEEVAIDVPEFWPITSMTYENFVDYFDNNPLNQIEGIWTMEELYEGFQNNTLVLSNKGNSYKIAIIKDPDSNIKFNAYIIESQLSHWESGMLKGIYSSTSFDNIYEEEWFMANFSSRKEKIAIEESGLIISQWTQAEMADITNSKKIQMAREGVTLLQTSTYLKIYPQYKTISSTNKKSGSGFLLSDEGYIVTNYHVIDGSDTLDVNFPIKNITKKATISLKDKKNDIAILKIIDFDFNQISNQKIPYGFSEINDINPGQQVFTIGFPLGDIMGKSPRYSEGSINSLYGLDDDPAQFQISTPLQPGNSGGALFNKKGELVGIVVSGLDAKAFSDYLGIVPQNVNFAIKINYLESLINMLPNSNKIKKRNSTITNLEQGEQVEQLSPFIVQIISN